MSTSNPYNATTNSTAFPQNLTSPENIRSIFFTNLLLLGIQEHSSEQSASLLPIETTLDPEKSRSAPQAHTGLTLQNRQHILIYSRGKGINTAKPLELHKHVFAKGHQSTKALEFVLWFLFTRLDKSQARERFRECWPILDRHDAREFRNVTFKWLDELRKEGCFGVGHGIRQPQGQMTGLGVFLHTIRRSYLDESIGERIEQLVLVLSTYVLSRTIAREDFPATTEDDRLILDTVGATPETLEEEDAMMTTIESNIVSKSQSFIQDMGQQRKIRQSWSSLSSEMTKKLNTLNSELTKMESERRTFLAYQPQLDDRTHQLTLSELHVLEDRWIEKINALWRPILAFVEHQVGRKEVIQSLLDSDSGKGGSVLNGGTMHMNLPATLIHMADNQSHGNSKVELNSIFKIWKRSLQLLELGELNKAQHSENVTSRYTGSLEMLSASHSHQFEKLQEMKRHLESRLKESSRRVDVLQSEQKSKQQPYRRLLSTLPIGSQGVDLPLGASSKWTKEDHQDAVHSSNLIFSALEFTPNNKSSSDARLSVIRNQAHRIAQQDQRQFMESHTDLPELSKLRDQTKILLVQAPVVAENRPTRPKPLGTHKPELAVKAMSSLKDTVTKAPVSGHKSYISKSLLSRSVIQPPSSILAQAAKNPLASVASFTSINRTVTPQDKSAKPVPADLIARDGMRDHSYDAEYNEVGVVVEKSPSVTT
ncbi:HAUS augmin-like complex subunit 6 [Haplosporangium sp. Z 27]|nr:HAUS augmin-like complex subunit 6 [Haplosporangium sp. Z 27]